MILPPRLTWLAAVTVYILLHRAGARARPRDIVPLVLHLSPGYAWQRDRLSPRLGTVRRAVRKCTRIRNAHAQQHCTWLIINFAYTWPLAVISCVPTFRLLNLRGTHWNPTRRSRALIKILERAARVIPLIHVSVEVLDLCANGPRGTKPSRSGGLKSIYEWLKYESNGMFCKHCQEARKRVHLVALLAAQTTTPRHYLGTHAVRSIGMQ